MKTQQEIEFDFHNALYEAEHLEELADRMDSKTTRGLAHSIQELSAVWQGEGAKEYLRHEDRLKTHVKRSAQSLRGVADDVRAAARRLYAAEMEAVRIASARLNG